MHIHRGVSRTLGQIGDACRWAIITTISVAILAVVAMGQPTQEQVDQLAETARKLRDQAERIKVEAHAAGRDDLAQAALVIQRLGETAVSSRVLLDKLLRLPTEPPSEETAHVSSPPTAPPAGPPPPAVALEIPADAVVLSGGEVKLKSNTVYTGRANRVYAGEVRNVQLIGLKIDAHGKHEGIRLVGKIENILIAHCQISGARNGIDIEARASGDFARNITIRDTVISDANTANLSGHSQGVYVYNVDGLTIERCTIRGAGRPITIFNHGLYLSHSRNIVIRNNVIADSSSFAIKLRSDVTGGISNVIVESNLFDGGANGITIGGDSKPDFAFAAMTIRANVFKGLGRNIGGNPQAFGIDAASCDGLLIQSNQFEPRTLDAPQPAIRVRDLPQRGVLISGNTFDGWAETVQVDAASGVTVEQE